MRLPTHLTVRARGTALVQDHDALDAGIRRYIGRRLDASDCVPATEHPHHHGNTPKFVTTGEVKVRLRPEVMAALRDHDLWPCDEATARAVWGDRWQEHFDPKFGGEFDAEKVEG